MANDFDYSPENPLVMDALGMTESNQNSAAVSPAGAMGLNQIMPATWKDEADEGMDPFNSDDNSAVAKKYLGKLYSKYGDIKLAAAAYNAGPGTIDKYLKGTQNKTFDEVAAKMEEAGSYEETRKYVPKFLANLEQAKQKQSSQYGAVNTPETSQKEQGMGSKEDFAKTMLGTLGDPLFDVLPASEKVRKVAGIYKSRQWDPDVDPLLKDVTTNIWSGADPEEEPNFNEILGAPPLVKSDENPDESLNNWKVTALDELDKQGINPNLFGKQLDDYIDNATKAEKDAYTARNRTPANWALNRAGNYVREGAKGAAGIVTQAAAGAIRLGGAPFDKGQETADAITNLPEVYLGTPASDFMYVTDENGYPKQNPDGSFQTHWQAEAAQGIGMVAGAIGTLGTGAVLGVSSRVLASANIGANTLGLANSSFKTVYDETGDIGKAYTAAAFSLPAGIIGSIGEWGIVSGAFRPALQSLTKYDQARFLAQAFTRNVAVGGISGAGQDVVQQYGEGAQTGADFNAERTAKAAIIGGVGSGVAGTVFDTIQGRSEFRARENARATQVASATNALTTFRNGVDGESKTSIDAKDIPPDVANNLGIDIVPNPDGSATLTKRTDILIDEGAEVGQLVDQLTSLATPDEVLAMGERQARLASKEIKTSADLEEISALNTKLQDASRPEYLNNIKAVERAILTKLNEDPSALPVRYEDGAWFNVESGEVAPNLKELLSPKKDQAPFDHDVSDLSYIKVIDEDSGTPLSKSEQNKVNKVKLKGLGAAITKGNKTEIVLPKGLDEASKREVLAHEIAHAVTNKVNLTAEANLAVEGALADLNVRALAEPASEMAKAVFLPNVRNLVKIPEGVTLKGLEKESQKALTSKREFLANQIGAIILERGGHDIGDYKIIPELKEALSKTKLPELNNEQGLVSKDSSKRTKESESIPGNNNEVNRASEEAIPASNNERGGKISPPGVRKAVEIDARTGDQGETAYSRTVRESISERPANLYEKVSRLKGAAEADGFVREHGLDKTIEMLSTPESYTIDPVSHITILEAALRKANSDLDENPTPANKDKVYKLDQLRGSSLTPLAQAMSMAQTIKGSPTFGDFLVNVKKAYEANGQSAPEYTEFMLKELKALYDQANGLPEGGLRDSYVQLLADKTLKDKKINWADFASSSIYTNLLSGVGTNFKNFEGGAWMAALMTALAHPVEGAGLSWRAIINAIPMAKAEAKVIFEGKRGKTFVSGLMDPTPLDINDTSTLPRTMASLYNKFGRAFAKTMMAADTFNRTLATSADLAHQKYVDLKAKYGQDPAKFTAEVAKILLTPEQIQIAKNQAEREGAALGLNLTDADKAVRAFEILRRKDTPYEMIESSIEYANSVSLKGEVVNPIPLLFNNWLTGWAKTPVANKAQPFMVTFGRAVARMADYTMDMIPGNILIDKMTEAAKKKLDLPQRSPALRRRLINGQKVGTGLAITLLGLSRSGMIQITGDEEIALDRGGDGDSLGKRATTRAQFKESQQKGIPPYSILVNGQGIIYKDIPGFNAIAYGIYRANKAIDAGMNPAVAGYEFFKNAFVNAVPLMGINTLSSPYVKLVDTFTSQDAPLEKVLDGLKQIAGQTAKMLTPMSGLMTDIKDLYDSTPEETNQDAMIKAVSYIPGASEMFGSKPMINRFGREVHKTPLQRTPGLDKIIAVTKDPSDAVSAKALEKGLIIPELQNRVKFNKGAFPSDQFAAKYQASREERLGKAYTNSFTPDEWYAFVKTTGPYVERVTNQVASSSLPLPAAQKELLKRVRAIEDQAKKRYIRTGKF